MEQTLFVLKSSQQTEKIFSNFFRKIANPTHQTLSFFIVRVLATTPSLLIQGDITPRADRSPTQALVLVPAGFHGNPRSALTRSHAHSSAAVVAELNPICSNLQKPMMSGRQLTHPAVRPDLGTLSALQTIASGDGLRTQPHSATNNCRHRRHQRRHKKQNTRHDKARLPFSTCACRYSRRRGAPKSLNA